MNAYELQLISYIPLDVRFDFPRDGRVLWSNSSLLSAASPYWKTLLESGLQESQASNNLEEKRKKKSKAAHNPDVLSYSEDSDFESETVTDFFHAPGNEGPDSIPVHRITIVKFSFLTYKAVLSYFQTGTITFAKINSPSTRFARHATSPKSMYRRCHLLEVENVKNAALYEYQKQLTLENVVDELFRDMSRDFPDIQDAALQLTKRALEQLK